MWIMLHDCFFSIVSKDCAPDELMVRARRRGDIEKLWPDAQVTEYTRSDYLFRAPINRADVITKISVEIDDIDYDNFKDQVADIKLHNAYLRVWHEMAMLQPLPPYSGMQKRLRKKK